MRIVSAGETERRGGGVAERDAPKPHEGEIEGDWHDDVDGEMISGVDDAQSLWSVALIVSGHVFTNRTGERLLWLDCAGNDECSNTESSSITQLLLVTL